MDSLQNQLLVAMPNLDDPFFGRTVTYICEHNAEGAMGIVLNHPLELSVSDLLTQLDIAHDGQCWQAKQAVVAGGPVQPDRGFILHTPKAGYSSSVAVSDEVMITTSQDILADLASANAPERFLLALGYAGWTAGQLEQEIADNSWLVLPASALVMFDLAHDEKWQGAALHNGISLWQLSNVAGHA